MGRSWPERPPLANHPLRLRFIGGDIGAGEDDIAEALEPAERGCLDDGLGNASDHLLPSLPFKGDNTTLALPDAPHYYALMPAVVREGIATDTRDNPAYTLAEAARYLSSPLTKFLLDAERAV